MAPIIEEDRVRKEISKFESLLETIKKWRYKPPHLRKFQTLIEECHNALKEKRQLSRRIREITTGVPPEIASRRMADLRFRIKRLFDVMYVVLSNSRDIPREIYFLSDIFLEYHEVPSNYVIFVSDEIAMFSFIDVLESIGFREWYPEFWNKMRDKTFYFVQIVSEFKGKDSSLDWPIILHEIAHVICYQMKADQRYLPELSIRRALEVAYSAQRQEFPEFLIILAKKKLYINEYLADLLVTRCFGAFYGWRLLKGYVSLKDIFEPGRSHPSPDKRLQRISSEVKNELQMSRCARFLDQELQLRTRELAAPPESRVPEIDVEPILSNVLSEARKYGKYVLTFTQIKESIRASTWFQTLKRRKKVRQKLGDKEFDRFLKQLQEDLLQGIPLILDPPTLYFLATLDFSNPEAISKLNDKKAELIRKLIADATRLYAIQHQYITKVKR